MRAPRLLGLLLVPWLLACGPHKPPKSAVPAYALRGVLRPTEQLTPPFTVQQRIHGRYAGGEATIDCVVQLQNGKLTVLGLTPFGTRAFVIEQTGLEVRFQKFVDRDLPVEAEAVLYDIHRVFFRALPPPAGDGISEGQDNGDIVHESWVDGHIVERRFENLEGPINNLVVVTFDGAPAPVIAPRVRITNAAFAYTLEIENTEQKLLGDSYSLSVQSTDSPSAPLSPDVVVPGPPSP